MRRIHISMVAVFTSFLLASCGMMSSPFKGVNEDAVASANTIENIQTKDLYGAWAIANEDETVKFLYVVILMPNHQGVNYVSIDEKDGLPESEYTEGYVWQFNEKDKVFTSRAVTRTIEEKGGPAKTETIDETEHFNTTLYQLDTDVLAVRFTAPNQDYVFLKMDNETYESLVKSVPGLPKIQ